MPLFPSYSWTEEQLTEANPPEGFRPIVSHSRFGWRSGPVFESRNDAGWSRGFRVLEDHTNAGGMCHGGMLMTFADIVAATAVLQDAPPPFVTVRLTSDFMVPAIKGSWVAGSAQVTSSEKGLVHVKGALSSDGQPCLGFSGMFRCLRPRQA